MKIAFISYEYPPETAHGGIATYIGQAAHALRERGHHVEVFAGGADRLDQIAEHGIVVHRVASSDQAGFAERVAPVFARRHASVGFDVLEGPDFNADAREAVRMVPDIPLVVRLHAPSLLISRIVRQMKHNVFQRASITLKCAARGTHPFWDPDHPRHRTEKHHALDADELVSPSLALKVRIAELWGIDPRLVWHLPPAYVPDPALLEIPTQTHTRVVTFVGRVDVLKGAHDLAAAIPQVVKRHPDVVFRFVGRTTSFPRRSSDLQKLLVRKLRHHRDSVEFLGPIPLALIPEVLATTDICVFPSYWDNFPNACLEAMAAGRGVVASSSGGMSEMLDSGRAGRLIEPGHPKQIGAAINELLAAPELRIELGRRARARLLDAYSAERIGPLQEASYARAIERRRARGARDPGVAIVGDSTPPSRPPPQPVYAVER